MNRKSSFSILQSQQNVALIRVENLYDKCMDIQMEIQQWVRQARKEAGLSGAELGAKLALELRTERGHSKANISHWELGRHQPSTQQLVAISKITGVPLPNSITSAIDLSINNARTPNAEAAADRFEFTMVNSQSGPRAHLHWLNDEEEGLLTTFRCTDDEGRRSMLQHASVMPITLLTGITAHKR